MEESEEDLRDTAESLYNQQATHFAQQLFIKSETEVPGAFTLDLADDFMANLVFPGCRLTTLNTKRPGDGRMLNMGEFTDRRWKASVKKILAGQYAVVWIDAKTPHFPNQKISLTLHLNPPGQDEILTAGSVEISCSIPYLRHLAASPDKIEALLRFGRKAWDHIDGGPAYGYANLMMILARPVLDLSLPRPADAPLPWEYITPPAERAHAIPIAYGGTDIEGNLEQAYVRGRGIKGGFWANYLASGHVKMVGGEEELRAKLPGVRVERLSHDGLLAVATDSPLPEDTEENRQRFLLVHQALRPAFLSREEATEMQKGMLSYFYREREDPFGS